MIKSKLPHVGTTIFSQMSALAQENNAINLSQGFPEFDGPELLKERTKHYIANGFNQYAPMPGVVELRQEISRLVLRSYQRQVCPEAEITITSGATEALFVAIQSIVKPGDEVILFDPSYDSYAPAIILAGGIPVHLELCQKSYQPQWQQVTDSITEKTKLIIINTPHNPSATCLSDFDLHQLEQITLQNNLFVISDEVYEHIVFDKKTHQSVHRYSALAERSFIISSFGKTFHMTGWKLGYCVAPKSLTIEFRKIHQYVTFSSFTPAQMGLADMLSTYPDYCEKLGSFYQEKRDFFLNAMKESRFNLLPSSGSYFVVADYSQISALSDLDFCIELTQSTKVAAVPMSVFYQSKRDDKVIRFCFAKEIHTLQEAANRLCQL